MLLTIYVVPDQYTTDGNDLTVLSMQIPLVLCRYYKCVLSQGPLYPLNQRLGTEWFSFSLRTPQHPGLTSFFFLSSSFRFFSSLICAKRCFLRSSSAFKSLLSDMLVSLEQKKKKSEYTQITFLYYHCRNHSKGNQTWKQNFWVVTDCLPYPLLKNQIN